MPLAFLKGSLCLFPFTRNTVHAHSHTPISLRSTSALYIPNSSLQNTSICSGREEGIFCKAADSSSDST
uniref:Uncharacterized protein n=1 Tax=Daphnia magna TaxID=35525 RepID=A0A0P6GML3_9CRUS